jgi:hypothetical protein
MNKKCKEFVKKKKNKNTIRIPISPEKPFSMASLRCVFHFMQQPGGMVFSVQQLV